MRVQTPQNCLQDTAMLDLPGEVRDGARSAFTDAEEPKQKKKPRKNSRQFSSFDMQCLKMQQRIETEMAHHTLIQQYWHTLTPDQQQLIHTLALERIRQGHASPRITLFWHWFLNERPDGTLNWSDFARILMVQRHVVSRQIVPEAVRCLVMHIDAVLLAYLTLTLPMRRTT